MNEAKPVIEGSGVVQYVDGPTMARNMKQSIKEALAKSEHLWTFSVLWKISPEWAKQMDQTNREGTVYETPFLVDKENILFYGGPVCYLCEAVEYTDEPCPGTDWEIPEPDEAL